MLAAPVVLVALLLSAETIALDAPARGSVNGPWALVDLSFLGATSVPRYTASSPAILGGQLALNGGLGFQVGSVRFSPTARFSIAPLGSFGDGASRPFGVTWSPVELALAAPDLLNDTSITGLRLTPVFGVTVPTNPGAFAGSAPLTTISLAGQLERRFGPVELAYRLEGSSSPCLDGPRVYHPSPAVTSFSPRCLSSWTLSNKLFAEAWFGSLSFALGLGWTTRWEVLPESRACVPGLACVQIPPLDPTHNVSARLLGTWAFTERFGTTLELNFSHVPGTSSLNDSFAVYRSNSAMGGSLSIWFRTDGVLQRNWLDR